MILAQAAIKTYFIILIQISELHAYQLQNSAPSKLGNAEFWKRKGLINEFTICIFHRAHFLFNVSKLQDFICTAFENIWNWN